MLTVNIRRIPVYDDRTHSSEGKESVVSTGVTEKHAEGDIREDVVQSGISEGRDMANAELGFHFVDWEGCSKLSACAEIASDLGNISPVEVAAALELEQGKVHQFCHYTLHGPQGTNLVLQEDPLGTREELPPFIEVGPLAEGVEPDEGANNNNAESVDDASPVENDEREGDMIALNDGRDRDNEGNEEGDAENQAG